MKLKYSTLMVLCALLSISLHEGHAQSPTSDSNFQNASIDSGGILNIEASKNSSKHDFSFIEGRWKMQNSMGKTQNDRSLEAIEQGYMALNKKIIDGLGYICNYRSTADDRPHEEIQLILFDPKRKLWSIYLANGDEGKLNKGNPLVGSFEENVGVFYAQEKNAIKRLKWERVNTDRVVYTEAFSSDSGNLWEVKRRMVMHRSVKTEAEILQEFLTIDKTIPIPELKFDDQGELVITSSATSSKHDFDFLTGKWKMYHKRLKERLNNNNEWEDLESMDVNYGPMLNGIGNSDLYTANFNGEYFEGYTLRLFNPETRLWSLYWVASNSGVLDPPVVGSMDNDIGHFFCKDTFKGQEVIVVFRWDFRDKEHPIWSQAFSPDRGKSWEWNWINVSYRTD